jgi:hypothetical protein
LRERGRGRYLCGMTEPAPRKQATCPHCGSGFACEPRGTCWCAAVPYRLPLDAGATRCFCPRCLDEVARARRG